MGPAASPASARTIGRYAIHDLIASGGMATVHLGLLVGQVGFRRLVAIKTLHAQYAKDPAFVTMLMDEARTAARVRHPNVAQTFDVVAMPDELFLIMEYVHGESLARLIQTAKSRGAPIVPRIACSVVAGVLHGLHAAHEARDERGVALDIVHRDISPQNVIVGVDGVPRIIDFGIAKAADRMLTTREGQIKGKLGYMAPEQLRGAEVTRQSDVYGASVVLWEALTGEPLFTADTQAGIIDQVLAGAVRPPSERVAGLSPELDKLVLKGLARAPGKRYASARDMAVALEAHAGLAAPSEMGDWVVSLAAERLAALDAQIAKTEQGPETVVARPAGPLPAKRPPRSWRAPLLAVLALTAIVVVAMLWRQRARAAPLPTAAMAHGLPMDPSASSAEASTPPVRLPVRQATSPGAAHDSAHALPSTNAGHGRCDPPYVLDAHGDKRYKVNCL